MQYASVKMWVSIYIYGHIQITSLDQKSCESQEVYRECLSLMESYSTVIISTIPHQDSLVEAGGFPGGKKSSSSMIPKRATHHPSQASTFNPLDPFSHRLRLHIDPSSLSHL